MADTEVWDLGGPIAAPAAADRVPIATGANSGGYSLRSDFVWKNAAGQYLIGTSGSAAAPAISFSGDTNTGVFSPGADTLGIAAGGTERLRIISSGGVTMTLSAGANTGLRIEKDGAPSPAKIRWEWNHRTNDTDLLLYGYDGTLFKNMILADWPAGELKLGTNNFPLVAGVNYVRAGADNSYPMGQASFRWSIIYAASGTINTSDEREKTWRGAATVPELAAAKRIIGELGFFQWNDSIVEKGAANARYHFGVRAQQVWAIMADEGLIDPLGSTADPTSKYAFLCWDRWDDHLESRDIIDAETGQPTGETETVLTMPAGDRFGIRPDQLALFLIAAQQAMIDDHEARLAALEGGA